MKPLLILATSTPPSGLPLVSDSTLDVVRMDALPESATLDPRRAIVLVCDAPLHGSAHDNFAELAATAALVVVYAPGVGASQEESGASVFTSILPADAPRDVVAARMRHALHGAAALLELRTAKYNEQRSRRELTELAQVGAALSTERDLTRLLDMIVTQARRITWSDAGTLYLVERHEDGSPPTALQFKVAQNHSLPNLSFTEFTVTVDHTSLAGHAASTGEPMVIDDVYLLPENVPYRQNRSFDDKFGYRTKSMLVIPMKTHREDVIAVLQLINRKRRHQTVLSTPEVAEEEVLPYTDRDLEVVTALAAQAGVAIENNLLYEDIEKLFEGFVTAAVTAIEQRDPTTSGHSGRVATLTVGLAEAVSRGGVGRYRTVEFSADQIRELRYAGLLHDFGKVGVREQVLVKQKKLYGPDLSLIRQRFAYLLQRAELQYERERADYLLEYGPAKYDQAIVRLDKARRAKRADLQRFMDAILKANEPTILPEGTFEELYEINERTYLDIDGVERPLLHDDELQFLLIRKGNLDERERREIESHVTHTFRFLNQIPWTRELKGIPVIAYGHHEKLDGRGYPRQVSGEAIPVQTRMMTISDIFDALTATDRPYKRAVSHERALDILSGEAKDGMLDRELLDTFIEAGVYRVVAKGDE